MTSSSALLVTEQDFERLALLIHHNEGPGARLLEEELGKAQIVPQKDVPQDLVTMNSKISFEDLDSGQTSQITLVYPKDADVTKGCVSILAPIGVALIGLRKGQSIEWPMPNGKVRHLKVVEILYQPEAAGHWDL